MVLRSDPPANKLRAKIKKPLKWVKNCLPLTVKCSQCNHCPMTAMTALFKYKDYSGILEVMNGMEIHTSVDEQERVVLTIAAGELGREAFVEWLQQNTMPFN